MSTSTYFKVELNTLHPKPLSIIEHLFYAQWDVWNIEELKNTKDSETFKQTIVYQIFCYELDEEESAGIINKIRKTAEFLNIDMTIQVIDPDLTHDEILKK